MNDFLINEGIPVTIFSNMITFRDSNKYYSLDGDVLETMTNNVSMLTILTNKIENK